MATIYKRKYPNGKSVWMLEFTDRHGKRRKKTLGNITKTRAKQVKAMFESKIANDKFDQFLGNSESESIEPVLLPEFKAKVMAQKNFEVKYATIQSYENAFNKLIDFFPNDKYTDDFTRSDIIEFRNHLRGQGLAIATVNKIHRTLDAAFQCGVEVIKCMESNPFKKDGNHGKLKQLKEDKKLPPIMPAEHILLFFDSFEVEIPKEFKDYLYFLTMYSTGCRPGELSALRWRDIHFDADIPYVIFRAENTKGKKENPVPLTRELVEGYLMLKNKYGCEGRPFDQIILTDRSRPSKIFKKYTKRAGIDKDSIGLSYTPYWLRHTLGSTSEAPIQDISALYNHSDVKVTQKYSHREKLQTKLRVIERYPSLDELRKKVEKGDQRDGVNKNEREGQ